MLFVWALIIRDEDFMNVYNKILENHIFLVIDTTIALDILYVLDENKKKKYKH